MSKESVWLSGTKSTPGRGSSQSKLTETGSCLAYLRSGTNTVALTGGLIKERHGGMG